MPNIPTITSQIAARSARTTAGIPSPTASAESFGMAGARALGAVGGGLSDVGTGLTEFKKKRMDEDVANRIAQSDFTSRELALRNTVGPDGAGYQDKVMEEYDAFVEEQADAIEDDATRAEFRRRMQLRRDDVSSRSATYEFGAAAEYSNNQINTSLAGLDNRIRLQPDQFADLLQQGVDVINASTAIPATVKASAVSGWTNSATKALFEGRLETATDVSDLDAVMADLKKDEWATKLTPAGLDSLLSTTKQARNAFATKADADARAAVEFLEGRAKDLTALIPPEEIAAAQATVAKSNNPLTQARMARIARDQDILRNTRKLPPEQQRAALQAGKPEGTRFPDVVAEGIALASSSFGVSSSYIAGMVEREYGGQLKGDPNAIDYGVSNLSGASSAQGIAQIIDGTMLQLAASPGVQTVVMLKAGIDLTKMTKDEILALRSNPKVSLMFAAAYAAQNANILRPIIGREPTDGELYMAHFMGGGGAVQLLKAMKNDPTASAASLFPAQAKANASIFYKKDGTARTVEEVYGVLGSSFSGGATYIAYGDEQTRNEILKNTEQGLKDDSMTFAAGVGVVSLGNIDTPGGMAERGRDARAVADYYSIPYDEMKPFTKDDESTLKKTLAEGSADDVLEVLTRVQSLGGAMAKAGLKQISDLDPVYGYAGSLAGEGGQYNAARDVVLGQKRLEENPDIRKNIGVNEFDLSQSFSAATGNALFDASPSQRQAVMDAALAHYVETQVARGKANSFDETAFAASVDAVLGGTTGSPAVQEVNGEKTVLPPGLSGDMVETALQTMTLADWVAMSEQRLPPRYVDGSVVDPRDIEDEATLRPIGPGKYRVALSDGTYLLTGRGDGNGRLEVYVFTPDPKYIESVIQRTTSQDTTAPPYPPYPTAPPPRGQIDNEFIPGSDLLDYNTLSDTYKKTDPQAIMEWLNGQTQ